MSEMEAKKYVSEHDSLLLLPLHCVECGEKLDYKRLIRLNEHGETVCDNHEVAEVVNGKRIGGHPNNGIGVKGTASWVKVKDRETVTTETFFAKLLP